MASVHSGWKRLLGVERGVVVEGWDYEEAVQAFVVRVFLEAEAPRVTCPHPGAHVARVPWVRGHVGFTRQFEEQAAWLAVHTSRTAVSQLLRVAWRTVGRIVQSVGDEARARVNLLSGLRRIGIDELSHRKGHKYVTVVVCHDTGRPVWMAPGRDAATVRAFFDALGEERTAALELVSADGAAWIDEAVREKAPHVVRCLDTFHVVKEGLRGVFQARSPAAGGRRLDTWLAWAQRSRLTPFVKLARSIRSCRERIDATLQHGLTNARIEATNTQLRLLTRIAHGFHHVGAFISLAMLKLAGLCPHLPGR